MRVALNGLVLASSLLNLLLGFSRYQEELYLFVIRSKGETKAGDLIEFHILLQYI